MNRLYFLAPDQDKARTMADDLRAAGIDEHHVAVLVKQDKVGSESSKTALEKSGVVPVMQ